MIFPGYEQDRWVELQQYDRASWRDLVSFWAAFNRQLATVMAAIPDDARSRPRTRHNLDEIATRGIPATEPATLDYFMNDYVDHLEMHLRQVLGENWNEGSTAPPMGRGSR